jgi:tRNA uridine 5-carbamoylmethylation protein Kti12
VQSFILIANNPMERGYIHFEPPVFTQEQMSDSLTSLDALCAGLPVDKLSQQHIRVDDKSQNTDTGTIISNYQGTIARQRDQITALHIVRTRTLKRKKEVIGTINEEYRFAQDESDKWQAEAQLTRQSQESRDGKTYHYPVPPDQILVRFHELLNEIAEHTHHD